MSGPKIGQRCSVKDKDAVGVVAYVGMTEFAPGKWIGVTLDEPKGKNNGTVQGKSYFACADKHGVFVRQTQIVILNEAGAPATSPGAAAGSTASPRSSGTSTPLARQGSRTDSLRGSSTNLTGGSGGSGGSGVAPKSKSRLPMYGGGGGPTGTGRSPSFTNLKSKRDSVGGVGGQASAGTKQAGMQRERSFVEPNFVRGANQPPQVTVKQAPFSPAGPGDTSIQGSPSAQAAAKLSERLEEKVAHLQTQQELTAAKEESDDLKEKLETLKIKRAKDLEKLKEFEKMRIQYDQLVEFKARIMESQASLQKELQKAKHDAREAVEAKERHADEMADLSETVEMATLDKEMAEEKAETLQLELEAAKEKIEELTVDLDIIKTEMDGGDGVSAASAGSGQAGEGAGGAVTNYELKHLQAQNEKLRETLIKMRDLSAHEKSEVIRLTKDSEELKTQVESLTKDNDKVKKQNDELEVTIGDLQEQVDAALGAEEMVENLTVKTLDLEERVTALIEEKQDLEAMHEMDEEMQENLREAELEIREELDLVNAKMREMAGARDAAYEIIHDHETTITKFRDLVSKFQEQNSDLRHQLEKEAKDPASGAESAALHAAEIIDFKKMFAETKAHSKAIDMELRKCEVVEANRHISLMSSYMSSSFLSRGGDHEAMLALLLVPRILWKVSILTAQIKEKFVGGSDGPVVIDKNSLLKGHTVERFAFGGQMVFYLNCLMTSLHQYNHALNTCSPEVFLKIGTLYPEMSAHEKSVDFYIELLRKDQLDENVPIDGMEKCLNYFQSIYPLHMANERVDHTNHMANVLKVLNSGCECLETEVSVGKALMSNPNDGSSEVAVMMKVTEGEVSQVKALAKAMKRRLPQQETRGDGINVSKENSVAYPAKEALRMSEAVKELALLVRAHYVFGRSAAQQAGLLSDPEGGLPAVKAGELMHSAIDRLGLSGSTGFEWVRGSMGSILRTVTEVNKTLQDGDWDADPAKEREVRMGLVPPVEIRAETYKQEIREAESIKYKLENKEHDIKDLRRALKEKSEELSEMNVRKDKAEKRLQDATRDADVMREKLQRKLDDAQTLLKRKEKEFEETMDQLQNDIDSLESERGELKTKLKETTKKVFIESISRASPQSKQADAPNAGGTGPPSIGPYVPAPIKDSPMLLQQNRDLQMAILSIKEESYRRRSEEMRKRLARMKPITVPKRIVGAAASEPTASKSSLAGNTVPLLEKMVTSPNAEKRDISKEETPSLDDLCRRLSTFKNKVDLALTSTTVVDLTARSKSNKDQVNLISASGGDTLDYNCVDGRKDLVARAVRDKSLREESERLRLDVARFMASKRVGGEVEADFCKFPSPLLGKSINESEYSLVGRIKMPASDPTAATKLKTVPLIVGPRDLQQIHQKIF